MVGPGARVRAVRPIGGGLAQATDALTVDDASGRQHRLVLQRWSRPNDEDPGFTPAKEAAVLDRVAATAPSVPVPRVIAVDPDGRASGVASLLTERLPGRAPTDAACGRPVLLATLGRTLAAIHRVDGGLAAVVPPYRPFGSLSGIRPPYASARPELWAQALAVAAAPVSAGTGRFLHRDFHPGNSLWHGGRLTGIVDWTSASWGPPAADLAHLRINLALRVGVEAADHARDAFRDAGGELDEAGHHDLRTVFDFFSDYRLSALTGLALERTERYLEALLDGAD
jgi:aminoglycoside phosphotransferase (APT) family kinase protein